MRRRACRVLILALVAVVVGLAAAPVAQAAVQLSLASGPQVALRAGSVMVGVSGSDPAARYLVVGARPDDGRPCEPDLASFQSATRSYVTVVNGGVSEGTQSATLTPKTADNLRLCGYVTGASVATTLARAELVVIVDPGILLQGDCPASVPPTPPPAVILPRVAVAGRPFAIAYDGDAAPNVTGTTGPAGATVTNGDERATAVVPTAGAVTFQVAYRPPDPSAACVEHHPFAVNVVAGLPVGRVQTTLDSKRLGALVPGFAKLDRGARLGPAVVVRWACPEAPGERDRPSLVAPEPITATIQVARGLRSAPSGAGTRIELPDPCEPQGNLSNRHPLAVLPGGVRVLSLRRAVPGELGPAGGLALLHSKAAVRVALTLTQGSRRVSMLRYAFVHQHQYSHFPEVYLVYSERALRLEECGVLRARRDDFLPRVRLPRCRR